MGEINASQFKTILDEALKPIREDISDIRLALYGSEGRTGVVADARESLKLSKEHETILRGKDKASGMIKKMNNLWLFATTGAIGLFWKAWDYFSKNPPPHH